MTDNQNHSPDNGESVFDLTPLVKSFHMQQTTGIPKSDGDEYVYEFKFPSTTETEINFTVDGDFAALRLFQESHERKHVMKMTQAGRYWFDRSFEIDVVMTGLEMSPDFSNMTATYEGMNTIDHTNYSYPARFLRWILRR